MSNFLARQTETLHGNRRWPAGSVGARGLAIHREPRCPADDRIDLTVGGTDNSFARRAPAPRRRGHHAGAAACSRDCLHPVRHLSARAQTPLSEQGSEPRAAERRCQPAITIQRKPLVKRWTLGGSLGPGSPTDPGSHTDQKDPRSQDHWRGSGRRHLAYHPRAKLRAVRSRARLASPPARLPARRLPHDEDRMRSPANQPSTRGRTNEGVFHEDHDQSRAGSLSFNPADPRDWKASPGADSLATHSFMRAQRIDTYAFAR
jgi:hypothetical protein